MGIWHKSRATRRVTVSTGERHPCVLGVIIPRTNPLPLTPAADNQTHVPGREPLRKDQYSSPLSVFVAQDKSQAFKEKVNILQSVTVDLIFAMFNDTEHPQHGWEWCA